MPKRQSIFTVKSEEVMGEGSYVKIRSMVYGAAKRLRVQIKSMEDEEKIAANDKVIIDHVVEWNWVDDNGEPLPLPKDDPAVLDEVLSSREVQFLGHAISGDSDEPKKRVMS